MALLDVSDVLDDPDFIDTFAYQRRVQVVDANGIASFATSTTAGVQGSVQAATPKDLERFADDARPGDWIRIYTRAPLVAQDEQAGVYADTVTWRSKQYQVRAVDDWSNYGAGYVKVIARLRLAGAP